MLWNLIALAVAVFVSQAFARQDQHEDGARQLYYLATGPKDSLTPLTNDASSVKPSQTGIVHLGIRYNVVLVTGSKSESVSADRVLNAGDCFAIDLESNRSGYLYVLAKQSSGSWRPLLPSPEMADENNVIDPGKKTRIPGSAHCFQLNHPPGKETLFVVLSRDPRDFYELYEGIKGKPGKANQTTQESNEIPQEMASAAKVDVAVEHLSERFGTRDIAIKRTDEPSRGDEPRGAVYVVNASKKPSSSIVTQIEIRHR